MDDLVYLKITTSNPFEIKVHYKYCFYATSYMVKDFKSEDWPESPKYYVVACRHCKPNIT